MKGKSAILIFALAVTVVFTAFAAGKAYATTGCFPDTNGHWAETFICWLKDHGITSGYPDGTYGPNNSVTRAEMSVFLQKSASLIRGTGTQFDSLGIAVAPGSSGNFASVSITAPSNGALLVNGSLNLYCMGAFGSCVASSGNTYVNVDGTRYNRQFYAIDSTGSNATGWNSSNTAFIPVAAGAHTVVLEVNNGGSGNTFVWSGGINVLFVVFDANGTPFSLSAEDPGVLPNPGQGSQGQ